MVLGEIEKSFRNKKSTNLFDATREFVENKPELLVDLENASINTYMSVLSNFNALIRPINQHNPNIDILQHLLLLQVMFYKLSENRQDETLYKYEYITVNCQEIYKELYGAIDEEGSIELTFKFNANETKVKNLDDLKSFCDCAKMLINFIAKGCALSSDNNPYGHLPFILFQREIVGNEEKWSQKIKEYLQCYEAYCHYQEYKKKTPLIKLLQLNEDDEPNSLKKINKILARAESLKLSAEKGYFPYDPTNYDVI